MGGKPWTREELEILQGHYSHLLAPELAPLLPERSSRAIKKKAHELGISKEPGVLRKCSHYRKESEHYHLWTEEEDNIIRENYLEMSYTQLGKLLGKPWYTVKSRARRLGLKKPRGWARGKGVYTRLKSWTGEEIELLKKLYPTQPINVLAELLSRHSKSAIQHKASDLGLRKAPDYRRNLLPEHRYHISLGLLESYTQGRHRLPPGQVPKMLKNDPLALAYIIGVFWGDGSKYKDSRTHKGFWVIRFHVGKSEEFAKSVGVNLARLGLTYNIWYMRKRNQIQVVTYSKSLYELLEQPIDQLLPLVNKTDVTKYAMLKGFWDAEGSKTCKEFNVVNTNPQIIKVMHDTLYDLGYIPKMRRTSRQPPRKDIYYVTLGVEDTQVFWQKLREVCPCLEVVAGRSLASARSAHW